jgi:5,5'-dehydrodivanillate O-demethylase oxygenase subunit
MATTEVPGASSAADWTDFIHTGPDTLAGKYLRSFWQPVYRAQDLLPGRTMPIRIMGEQLTLYRGESGTPHLVAFRCAHRGTQLSVGWVEDDCIRCRYHGWMYDASGQCVEQPGEEPSAAERVKIRSYPTEEYLGLIFAYLGEGAAPPIRRYPDFDAPGVFEADPPEVWPCNYFNRAENDPYHVYWTHKESNRRRNMPNRPWVPEQNRYAETDYGFSLPNGHTSYFHMPNTMQLRTAVRVPGFEHLAEYRLVWHMPIDDQECVAFDVNLVPDLTGEEGERFRAARRALQEDDPQAPIDFAEAVLAGRARVEDMDSAFGTYKTFWIEDYVTLVGQGAIPDRAQERLGRTDQWMVVKRMLWQRELKALAEGRPLKEWTSPTLFAHADNTAPGGRR